MGYPVKEINGCVFCSMNLTSVVLPNTLVKLSTGDDDPAGFANNNLTSITLPDSLEMIGYAAFRDNKLTEVTIPNNVTMIGLQAFLKNEIDELVLGSKVEIINLEAFENNNITTLTIPSSVKKIWPAHSNYRSAFKGNPMQSVIIEGKTSASEFEAFIRSDITPNGTPFIWDENVTCVKDNMTNVENGCITWLGNNQ